MYLEHKIRYLRIYFVTYAVFDVLKNPYVKATWLISDCLCVYTKGKFYPSATYVLRFRAVSPETYDKIKIFLISNFNIAFVHGETPDIVESFEVEGGRAVGKYYTDESLFVASKSDTAFLDDLSNKITELPGVVIESVDETECDIGPILDHLQNCDRCRSKLSEIISHIDS